MGVAGTAAASECGYNYLLVPYATPEVGQSSCWRLHEDEE
jgi:hypothetical protein